ncbi:ABC transporter substrate-binding protein [Vibrio nereis]|uniref:Peptide ABC transporter substrate-binding protein n=1 Tax=Vibrio nereis TaxID=693 RepID=A0A0M0HQ83_VIBNE|nr:iron-siderophore ABC transporter substrate-binding protein [Vibrio nereis]KOO04219.1 peptide ABC transporter substrate-binding protein [Vibrio nereis]
MKKISALLLALLSFNIHALEIQHEMGTATFNETPKKVIALDWVLAETVLSLGVKPLGVVDVTGYQNWVVQPQLNKDAVDVGSRREPNLELITSLKPDVILISKHLAPAYEQLNAIAPVVVHSVYNETKQPIEAAKLVTLQLGTLLDREQKAKQVIQQTLAMLKANGDKVRSSGQADKPLLFARFINDKTLRIHSQGSLAQATIDVMGLNNSWQEQTNVWGFTTSGTEKLAEHQQTNLMLFGPLKESERQKLTTSPLWQAMEFTRTNSVYELPAIWTFGGLIAAQRFSENITQQLINSK